MKNLLKVFFEDELKKESSCIKYGVKEASRYLSFQALQFFI